MVLRFSASMGSLFFGFFLFLTSCSDISTNSAPSLNRHLNQRVAIIAAPQSSSLPEVLWDPILQLFEKRLMHFESFQSFSTRQQQQQLFENNLFLQQKKEQYTTTLSLVEISDRDLSIPVAQYLGVDQFLMVHLDRYFCTGEGCDTDERILIRLLLVNAKEGRMIWRGRLLHDLLIEEQEPEIFTQRILELSNELLSTFINEFLIPWHEKRYQHLSQEGDAA